MSPTDVADLIDQLVTARLAADRCRLVNLFNDLLQGPRGDSLDVALVLAGCVGDGIPTMPGEDFHRLRVEVVEADGRRRAGSAGDLPAHAATFMQMVVAINNDDKAMATDLYIGFVGDEALRALHVLAFGLEQLIHRHGACPQCTAEGESA